MADALNQLDVEKEIKRLNSIKKTPEGREAIKQVLQVDLTTPAQLDRPIVAILVPCYKAPHPRMNHYLNLMVDLTRKIGAAYVFLQPYTQTSVVHWSRNGLVAELIKSGKPFTHVLFVDDDIAPPDDGLVKLLMHEKDIVAGLCTRRMDPPIPNMRLINMETCDVGEVWKWKPGELLGDNPPPGHTFAIGTGFMLISKEALRLTAEAYMNCDYERDVHGWSDEKIAAVTKVREQRFNELGNGWWFDFARPKGEFDQFGEDIYFCWFAKKYCGINTYIDTSVMPEHWGDYGYCIQDYLSHTEEAIKRAKAKGTYIPPALLESEEGIISPMQEAPKITVVD